MIFLARSFWRWSRRTAARGYGCGSQPEDEGGNIMDRSTPDAMLYLPYDLPYDLSLFDLDSGSDSDSEEMGNEEKEMAQKKKRRRRNIKHEKNLLRKRKKDVKERVRKKIVFINKFLKDLVIKKFYIFNTI